MNALQIFNYKNEAISFKNENGTTYVNATEMAKSFGKIPANWLRTEQAKKMIEAISTSHICEVTQLLQVVNGGEARGTWMHEDVALVFSQWLSPEFYLWCNDRIKELMRHGLTTTEAMAEKLLNNPDFLIETLTALKSEREQKALLLEQTRLQQREIALVQPKAEYYDKVLQSSSVYVADQIAKELGISAVKMNKYLQDKGILIRRNGQLVLTAKYAGKGYDKPKTYQYTKHDGAIGTNTITTYTEKGREFLHSLFEN